MATSPPPRADRRASWRGCRDRLATLPAWFISANLDQFRLRQRLLAAIDPLRGVEVPAVRAVIVKEKVFGDPIGQRFLGNLVTVVVLARPKLHDVELIGRGRAGRRVTGAVAGD